MTVLGPILVMAEMEWRKVVERRGGEAYACEIRMHRRTRPDRRAKESSRVRSVLTSRLLKSTLLVGGNAGDDFLRLIEDVAS